MFRGYDRAWKLIEDPKRWCQNATAVDHKGVWISPRHDGTYDEDNIAAFCALGAIYAIYGKENTAVNRRLGAYVGSLIDTWNDSHTHAQVLSVLKELDI